MAWLAGRREVVCMNRAKVIGAKYTNQEFGLGLTLLDDIADLLLTLLGGCLLIHGTLLFPEAVRDLANAHLA